MLLIDNLLWTLQPLFISKLLWVIIFFGCPLMFFQINCDTSRERRYNILYNKDPYQWFNMSFGKKYC
jgi:hypothetical protein